MARLKFNTNSGHQVFLDEILQINTYSGHLEGVITEEKNLRAIEHCKSIAKKNWPHEPIFVDSSAQLNERGHKLPDIACIGLFISYEAARDEKKMASSMVVIWFQEELVSRSSHLYLLETILWKQYARDFDW